MRNRLLAAFGTLSLLFAFASCDQLQDELSSEQLKDQKSGIGSVSASSTTYYYDGSENDSVKGKEAHLVLDLSQIADATDAAVKYTLEYSTGSDSDKVEYSSAGSLAGTLSDSKTKYYINLAPAINLIDGTGEPAYGDIAYTFILSGLTNASGNDYNGRSFPSFSKTVKFAPLYTTDSLEFSSKSLPVGSEIKIPLNGEISEVAETVTAAVTSGSVTANFTAKVSSDGKAIVLTSKNDLSGEEFTVDFTITGIKPVGAKEEYEHTFSGVKFTNLKEVKIEKTLALTGEAQELVSADELSEYTSISKLKAYVKLSGSVSGNWWVGLQGPNDGDGKWSDLTWTDSPKFDGYNYEGEAISNLIASLKESGLYVKGNNGLTLNAILVLSVAAE